MQKKIVEVVRAIEHVLVEKNKRYGNSALEPKQVFSKLNGVEGIKIRLDDKLSRIMNSAELRKNDVFDVLGYLVLLIIACGWDSFDDLLD